MEDIVLVILNNHVSHISLDIYNFCRRNGVLLLSLPHHTSYRTQPLDPRIFGPLKLQYHIECDLQTKTNNCEKLTPYDIAPLFEKAYLKTGTMGKAVNGFTVVGIWPVNTGKFHDQYIGPIEILHTEQSLSETTSAEVIES